MDTTNQETGEKIVSLERRIELVMESITRQEQAIINAHRLGVPLEDILCGIVRKSLRNLDVNPEQMELNLEGKRK